MLDKKNNGFVDVETLKKSLVYRGKEIKQEHISEILNLLKCESKIPVNRLEELYEKYRYEAFYSSSEEEVRTLKKKFTIRNSVIEKPGETIEKFSLKRAKTIIKEKVEEKINSEVSLQEIGGKIAEFMKEKGILRVKVAEFIIGENANSEFEADLLEISETLKRSLQGLLNEKEITVFAKHLVESEMVLGFRREKEKIENILKRFEICIPNYEISLSEPASAKLESGKKVFVSEINELQEKHHEVLAQIWQKMSFSMDVLEDFVGHKVISLLQ